jgi:hypothetical protein
MATLIRHSPTSLRSEQYDKVNEILQVHEPWGTGIANP